MAYNILENRTTIELRTPMYKLTRITQEKPATTMLEHDHRLLRTMEYIKDTLFEFARRRKLRPPWGDASKGEGRSPR